MRMLARIAFHRGWGTTVGVAFAQYRVDRTAKHFLVAFLDAVFVVALWLFREIRNAESAVLQLGHGGNQLRNRCADIGKLDDVGVRFLGQTAEVGEAILNLLRGRQAIGELGQNSRRQ